MARTPAEVARDGYAAWNSGELDVMLAFIHPDLVWVTSGVFPGLRVSYSGEDGFREFWDTFTDPWETIEVAIEDLYELDEESVLIGVRFLARGRQGIEVDRRVTNHIVMREDKLYHFKAYEDWQHALDDLGIEDPRRN